MLTTNMHVRNLCFSGADARTAVARNSHTRCTRIVHAAPPPQQRFGHSIARHAHLQPRSASTVRSTVNAKEEPEDEDEFAEEGEEGEEAIDDPQRLYTSRWLPPEFYGPIEIKLIKGTIQGCVQCMPQALRASFRGADVQCITF
jgi:hypothetical protein